MVDPYATLGVPRTASTEEIKAAYRRIAKQTHPDLNSAVPENIRRFEAATEAYAILSHPDQRSRYDCGEQVEQDRVSATQQEIYAWITRLRNASLAAQAKARSAALRGVVWLVLGVAVTGISYAAAASSPNGGSYAVMWGAIGFGGLQALRGFAAYSRIGALARKLEGEMWAGVTQTQTTESKRVA